VRAEVSQSAVDDVGHGRGEHVSAAEVEEPGRTGDTHAEAAAPATVPSTRGHRFLLVETAFSNAKADLGRLGVSRLRTVSFEQRLRLLA
jgi:hypothetical protein